MAPAPRENAEPERASLARDAMGRARAANAAGRAAEALRWLERAHRVVPLDPNVALALATALLATDPARAGALYATVTARHDVLQGWLGQAAALLRGGNLAGARSCVARALSAHALRAETRDIASTLAGAIGAGGFCALDLDGTLTIEAAGRPDITLDGLPLRGRTMPRGWQRGHEVAVRVGGHDLLGSPISLRALCRTDGLVESHEGGLRGWAWHPADIDRPARLVLTGADGRGRLEVTADDPSITVPDLGPLAVPLGFTIPADALARFGGLVHLRGINGRDLYGSPIDPSAELRAATDLAHAIGRHHGGRTARSSPTAGPLPADLPIPSRSGKPRSKSAAIDVVVPVHGQAELTLACLDSLFATVHPPHRIVVVDDASPDPELAATLDSLAGDGRIRLIRNARNLGFPGAANAGLRAAAGRDVVLLNSDTIVPAGWLPRLRDAAHSAPDIGTVTPLSNDASILSYPGPAGENPPPADLAALRRIDALARKACGDVTVDIPVGVGFCLYLRRDCLDEVGLLREDAFAQGYGEENDLCLRARRLGWRSVALPGLFVAHRAGRSFGSAAPHLRRRNQALLERMHPGQDALVQAFCRTDPLAEWRRRIDLLRWRAARQRGGAIAMITHDEGGGVERRVAASCEAHAAAGLRVVVLRPARTTDDAPAVALSDGTADAFPNLVFRLPGELPALERLLRAEKVDRFEVHHFLNHHPAIHGLPARMDLPYTVHVHDYAWFCPRVLLVDGSGRYCGEPAPAGCETCIADHGALVSEEIAVAELRARSSAFLRGATRVITPSADTAGRIARHFPGLKPLPQPHEDDSRAFRPVVARRAGRPGRICVAGAIGVHKGYDVLLACARDAAARSLDIEFVVVGTTIDDLRLMRTGKVFITGAYQSGQAANLIAAQDADLGFVPSIAPETWCMTLTELWQAGLAVAAFDIGAPAERIRRTGHGFLLPSHLPPGAINNALADAIAARAPRHAPSRRAIAQ